MYVETEPDRTVADRHVARYAHAIKLANSPGGKWVDYACGSGYGTALIAEVADNAIGVDPSWEAIYYARHHYPSATFYCGGLWALRYTFTSSELERLNGAQAVPPDVIVSIETLEHMAPYDQDAFIDTVVEGLAPGGVFVLGCPIGTGPNPHNPWHIHEPTLAELSELLEAFNEYTLTTEEYESTSGPAVQAWAVAR
jgi:2-polyprenyl-3-methyl-5-hydroxy-6-metoxy-1,4-benzoquinol methylase